MARPAVTPFTDRLYARLPEYMRASDAEQSSGGGYPLLRYLSGVTDEAGKIAAVLGRFDYLPPDDRPPAPALKTISGGLGDLVPSSAGAVQAGVAPNGPTYVLGGTGSVAHTAYLASGRWRVDVVTSQGADRGIASVKIDGEPRGTFDSYAPAATYRRVLLSYEAVFTLGYHEVRVAATNTKNAASTGTSIDVYGVTFTQITSTGDDTSDLVDPMAADAVWLPWLGRLVGVNVPPGITVPEQRDAVAFATSGFRAGTKDAIAAAARSALTGTRHVEVYDHTIFEPGDGGVWDVLLITRGTETPDVAAVLKAVVSKNAKPAGVVLRHRTYDVPWATVETNYPTWDAIEAAGSWDKVMEAGL